MALTIYGFTNFKKRINSTKQPSISNAITYTNVYLKAPTSRENPTFIITPVNYDLNYIKWDDHYYFVTDIVVGNKDIMEVSCHQDVLATYKTDILATTAFVEYSTSDYNTDILDPRISNTGAVSRSSHTNDYLIGFFSLGVYIVSTVGTSGIANRYIMTAFDINTMMSYINTVTDDNILDSVVKKYGSLLNCIIGCTWVPFTPSNDGINYPVVLGSYTVPGLSCKRCSSTMIAGNGTTSINIPWINSDTPRKSRETIILYLPGYGSTQLDASKYVGLSSLNIIYVADITGGITYGIKNNGGTVDCFNTNVGAQVPITQFTQSPVGTLVSAYSNAMSWGSRDWAGSGMGMFGAIMSKTQSHISDISGRFANVGASASSIGGQGGMSMGAMAEANDTIVLTNYSFQYSEAQADMASRYGRPLMAVKSLSALTGYCKCNGASVNISGTDGDKQDVNAFVNSGFYIE